MAKTDSIAHHLREISAQLDHLMERYQRLADENRRLRQDQQKLVEERASLLTKNEQARQRVEAMIMRLKLLEQKI